MHEKVAKWIVVSDRADFDRHGIYTFVVARTNVSLSDVSVYVVGSPIIFEYPLHDIGQLTHPLWGGGGLCAGAELRTLGNVSSAFQ